jgi:hypothetical protein
MQANNILLASGSGFRLQRPTDLINGFVTTIDPRVKGQLDQLHALLSAQVFVKPPVADKGVASASAATVERAAGDGGATHERSEAHGSHATATSQRGTDSYGGLDPTVVLALKLTPRRAALKPAWAIGTLAAVLDQAVHPPSSTATAKRRAARPAPNPDELITLAEYVDRVPNLSTLKYSVDDMLAAEWTAYGESTRRVLDPDSYPGLRVYLVAYANLILNLSDAGAIKNFMINDGDGAAQLINYGAISAARELVSDRGYNIPDPSNSDPNVPSFDLDNGVFVTKLKAATIGLSSNSFEPSVMSVVSDLINDVEHKDLIDIAEQTLGSLSLSTRLLLARYIDAAPVPITASNIAAFATVWLAQNTPPPAAGPTDPTQPSDSDFDIEVYQDDAQSLQISRSAVLAAAQLYYTMVLGDELDVFAIVHYFTHKYLVRGGMEVTDPILRMDLQQYVFSNRFTDPKTGRLLDRSRPAERHMFYRQVFDAGHGAVPADLVVNEDYPPMWKVLMLETANYLERAQLSLNPDGFVSKQKVQQAVEDLQYDLSTHCTGMATVATPLIHAELNFCISRILQNPIVINQIVPTGGTWWRVVEQLSVDLRGVRPRSTALYNKAKLGHDIIKAIADYNPATFEDDVNFSAFVSQVDAYITTQSILQQALTDDLKRRQETDAGGPAGSQPPGQSPAMPPIGGPMPGAPPTVGDGAGSANGASGGGHASSEWDF